MFALLIAFCLLAKGKTSTICALINLLLLEANTKQTSKDTKEKPQKTISNEHQTDDSIKQSNRSTDNHTSDSDSNSVSNQLMQSSDADASKKNSEDWITHSQAHLLLCAPSNAAIDQVVYRLLQSNALRDESGKAINPRITRFNGLLFFKN
jgi:uncharacterized membrane protein YhiD involved in acid resistance